MWQRMVLVGILLVLLLLRGPAMMSAIWSNAGMLLLRDELLAHTDLAPGTYPIYGALTEAPTSPRLMQSLRKAVTLDDSHSAAQWALGRTALAIADAETAADVLGALVERAKHNPLIYYDALMAFSYDGRPEEVIALYETIPVPLPTQVISDVVALAYLERSRELGKQESAKAIERARELRPGDLYANLFLWKQAKDIGDMEAAVTYGQRLTYFSPDSVYPTDERLQDYVADVVPTLLEVNLWNRDKTLNVISFLARQHSRAADVERLIRGFTERYPSEPDWLFCLAEFHQGCGDLDKAEVVYRQVLEVDPHYAQAYLRLGMLDELRMNRLSEAATWYELYHEVVPTDLLGLRRLAKVCSALDKASTEDASCHRAANRLMGEQSSKIGVRIGYSSAMILWTKWLEQVATEDPEFFTGQRLENGWSLLGYDVDEDRLIRGEPVDLLLYWTGPVSASAGSVQEGWYRAGERWVQVLEGVHNLMLNGGFEMGVAEFPDDIYYADPGTRRLTTDTRVGWPTTVALLDNTQVHHSTSFSSVYVPVSTDGLYLQAGWVKSEGGNGFFGRFWVGDIAEGVRPYDYVAEEVREDNWRHYAKVTRPLQGATGCHIWLLNYMALGRVYFDNVLFVKVGEPGR